MVTDRTKDNQKTPEKQCSGDSASEPNKINASTPYDFSGKNLTPYGGLLPVITMLEKLDFQSLVEETLTPGLCTRSTFRVLNGLSAGLEMLCIETYAQPASATEQRASARG